MPFRREGSRWLLPALLGWVSLPMPASAESCCPILELRQYTLHPGQRDVLIDLFDREFVETQEAFGMRIVGQFRDLDKPDRFVWLRGFPSMDARATALAGFYGGPTWKAHRSAANATMVDSANVLLLHPARAGSGFSLDGLKRPQPGSAGPSRSLVVATIYYLDAPASDAFLELYERDVQPAHEGAGASVLGRFVTEGSANTFPALPVREGEHVLVVFSRFADLAAYERHLAELAGSTLWAETSRALSSRLERPPQTLRLSPTARSLLGR